MGRHGGRLDAGLRPWLGPARAAGRRRDAGRRGAPPARFVRQAAVAYAVYQPEQRHPVEVAADQQEHLVQWLSSAWRAR
jgi:anti-sigma factor RsiW